MGNALPRFHSNPPHPAYLPARFYHIIYYNWSYFSHAFLHPYSSPPPLLLLFSYLPYYLTFSQIKTLTLCNLYCVFRLYFHNESIHLCKISTVHTAYTVPMNEIYLNDFEYLSTITKIVQHIV